MQEVCIEEMDHLYGIRGEEEAAVVRKGYCCQSPPSQNLVMRKFQPDRNVPQALSQHIPANSWSRKVYVFQ